MDTNQQKMKDQNTEFKIRCSAISSISAKATAGRLISVGAQTYCKNWLKESLYNRRDNVSTKQIDKGLETEEDALNILVEVLKLGMVYKNNERISDEYKTGEVDFIFDGVIYDNKSSYSLQTFPLFDDTLDKIYVEQMKGYLDLWNLQTGKVCYTLVDTPIDILRSEIQWLKNDNEKQSKALNHLFTISAFEEAKDKLFPNAKDIEFTEIPIENRVKVFDVKRDDIFISHINNTVLNCRKYIDELKSKLI